MKLELHALPGIPRIQVGDDLVALTLNALLAAGLTLRPGDVLVYAQKIISKSEGRRVALSAVTPGAQAQELAALTRKDARLVELILRESRRIVRAAPEVLIVEHQLGLIMANAGIDLSNVSAADEEPHALLLPENPDASACKLKAALEGATGAKLGIVISDSFGRPWRIGTVGVAIGCAGVPATLDLRGSPDLFGRKLQVTVVGHADELAAAASLLMGQANEGQPIVLLRGLTHQGPEQQASALLRPPGEDLFR